jgi:hypothetical protein
LIEARTPRACGALGDYDRARVLRIAAALGTEAVVHHEAPGSILACNVEPLRWQGAEAEGLAWSDDGMRREIPGATSREQAAYEMSAAGLALGRDGSAAVLHSSVSGTGPVYWTDDGSATYFSSSIDSLVGSAPGPLTADLTAWSAIFCLGFPLGEQATPFQEVKRLPPSSSLRRGGGGPDVEIGRWLWGEQDPTREVGEAADEIAALVEQEVARLDGAAIAFPLSGGLDSRLLLGLVAKRHPDLARATTVNADSGSDREERLARAVADAVGYEHVMAPVDADSYADDFRERARLVDYQWLSHPWMLPLGRALAGEGAIAPHGLPMNAMLERDPGHGGEAIFGPGREAARGVFRTLAPSRRLPLFVAPAGEEMRSVARKHLVEIADGFDEHPMRPALIHLRIRSVRGIALGPIDTLGNFIPVAAPFLAGPLGSACMRAAPEAKDETRIYAELFGRIDPKLWKLPSTRDPESSQAAKPARRAGPEAVRAVCEAALASPLSPCLTDVARQRIERNDPELLVGGPQRKHLFALAMMGLWFERYGERLAEIDLGGLR